MAQCLCIEARYGPRIKEARVSRWRVLAFLILRPPEDDGVGVGDGNGWSGLMKYFAFSSHDLDVSHVKASFGQFLAEIEVWDIVWGNILTNLNEFQERVEIPISYPLRFSVLCVSINNHQPSLRHRLIYSAGTST